MSLLIVFLSQKYTKLIISFFEILVYFKNNLIEQFQNNHKTKQKEFQPMVFSSELASDSLQTSQFAFNPSATGNFSFDTVPDIISGVNLPRQTRAPVQ